MNARFKSILTTISSFFKNHLGAFHILIAIVLALLLVSCATVRVDSEPPQTVASLDQAQANALTFLGYKTTINADGSITRTPVLDDPQFWLYPGTSSTINSITLYFSTPISNKSSGIEVFYSINGEPFSAENCNMANIAPDGMSATATMPLSGYHLLRFDINEEFSLKGISLDYTNVGTPYRTANIGPIIALAICLIILAIVEKWVGFFKRIKALCVDCVKSCIALFKDKHYIVLAFRILCILSLTLLAFSYVIFIMLAKITTSIIIYLFFLTFFALAFFITDRIMSNKAHAPVLFLVTGLILCIFMCFAFPITTSNSWDEHIHYEYCATVRDFFFNDEKTGADVYQQTMAITTPSSWYIENVETIVNSMFVLDQSSVGKSTNTIHFYKYIGYLPVAFSMFVCDALDINFFSMIVISKLANAFIYLSLIYLAIRKLKSGALIFASIALMPTALFIASSFSYDYFVTAFTMYSFIYFISELQQSEKPFTVKDGILMLGAMLIGCGPKATYFVLLFPMLFMTKSKFKDKKSHYIYLGSVVAVALIIASNFLAPLLSSGGDTFNDDRGGAVSGQTQMDFILQKPLQYTTILLRFLGQYFSIREASTNSIYFAYMGTPALFIGSLVLGAIFFCAFVDRNENDLFKKNVFLKIVCLLTVFASASINATALYVSFTNVGSETINGCQWRYLIPSLPLLFYALGSGKIKNSMNKNVLNGIVFSIMSLATWYSFYSIYISNVWRFII